MKLLLSLLFTLFFTSSCTNKDEVNVAEGAECILGEWNYVSLIANIETDNSEFSKLLYEKMASDSTYFGNLIIEKNGMFKRRNLQGGYWDVGRFKLQDSATLDIGFYNKIYKEWSYVPNRFLVSQDTLYLSWDKSNYTNYPDEIHVIKEEYTLMYKKKSWLDSLF